MCLDLNIVSVIGPHKIMPKKQRPAVERPDRLYFNTLEPRYFEELYQLYTNETDFKITPNA